MLCGVDAAAAAAGLILHALASAQSRLRQESATSVDAGAVLALMVGRTGMAGQELDGTRAGRAAAVLCLAAVIVRQAVAVSLAPDHHAPRARYGIWGSAAALDLQADQRYRAQRC